MGDLCQVSGLWSCSFNKPERAAARGRRSRNLYVCFPCQLNDRRKREEGTCYQRQCRFGNKKRSFLYQMQEGLIYALDYGTTSCIRCVCRCALTGVYSEANLSKKGIRCRAFQTTVDPTEWCELCSRAPGWVAFTFRLTDCQKLARNRRQRAIFDDKAAKFFPFLLTITIRRRIYMQWLNLFPARTL